MKAISVVAVLAAATVFGTVLTASGDEPSSRSETPTAVAEAKPDADTNAEFRPPPGFKARKRGDMTLYCRKEAVLGSRFPAEKCYDQAGLREMKRADLERTEMLERMKACGTGSCAVN